ncbi:hypothetical protein KUV62_02065 [Salipiger bermudensis]|uniref:hypothetical protein n=1 Tax=Salipiger bermudensis TaxID=344736 RepID=UPI001C99E49F|nr:hypothetical protein [Salipiger bermudensis]MBY6002674.1 hypothetical protein [Salipiger bermudensis]
MRLSPLLLLLPLALTGCASFPDLDAARTPGVERAPFPALLPLDDLTRAPLTRATPELREGIEDRAEGLRARAARLQGPVVSEGDRARMDGGVALDD